MTLVELCAGTAAVSLYALGRPGHRPRPLTGYMGSKRRWAEDLCRVLGVADRQPDRVVLVDAGPWGDVWTVLRTAEGRDAVRGWLHDLDAVRDLGGLQAAWERAVEPPSEDPGRRVAYYLWVQARSAQNTAMWWNGELGRWQRGNAKNSGSHQASVAHWEKSTTHGAPGMSHPRTIAARIRALEALPWDRVQVVHGDNRAVEPIPSAAVYLDPPYLGCPRYAALLPRADVLDLARRWAGAGARVLVSEAEPLDLPGWTSRRLPGRKPEWLTGSWRFGLAEQLTLGAV